MEKIILVGHGSPKKDANQMDLVGVMLHSMLHPGCEAHCVSTAYLQFQRPELPAVLEEAVRAGATRVIVHPYFLASGMHVTKDIPGIIDEARAKYPDVEFIYTEPLGMSEKLVQVVRDRIESACGLAPQEIEDASMRTIEDELPLDGLPELHRPIVRRVIHATGDFDFRSTMMFHPDAVRAGIEAIRAGRNILTDVEMVRAGINKKLIKGDVLCGISEANPKEGETRSEAAIEAMLDDSIGIVAIGNAPTALLKCIELINADRVRRPALVVGVPVGFVRAVESKALLASQSFPFITSIGRKGGSPVAAAIVNAIARLAADV
jgi:precorrin-8X/cobalt-precorrin-8 methylmutase